jgi:hypothetical protein
MGHRLYCLAKKFPEFMECEGSSLCPKFPPLGPILGQINVMYSPPVPLRSCLTDAMKHTVKSSAKKGTHREKERQKEKEKRNIESKRNKINC